MRVIVILVVLAAAIGAFVGLRGPHREKAAVTVGPVHPQAIVDGTVESARRPYVFTCVTGAYVHQLLADVGTRVSRGAPLLRYRLEGAPNTREWVLTDEAPEQAVVEKVLTEAGTFCPSEAPALVLSDVTELEAMLELTGEAAKEAHPGLAVTVRPEGGGAAVAATVTRVAKAWTPRGRTAWATLPDAGTLALHQQIEATLELGTAPVTRVPRRALFVREGRAFVSTVGGSDVPVVVGALDADFAEVSGISAPQDIWIPQ